MVKITRVNHRGRGTPRKGGVRSANSAFTLRRAIVLLVVIQGARVLMSGNTVSDSSAVPHLPKSLEQQLADSKSSGSGGRVRGTKTVPKNEEPKETPATEPPKQDDNANPDENNAQEATDAPKQDDDDAKASKAHPGDGLNPIVVEKKGTGPTNVGYVKDFVNERKNPSYRNLETPAKDPSRTVAEMVNEKSVIACEKKGDGMINPKCLDSDTPLVAYNSESFARTWCGQEIGPKSAVVMTTHCTDPIAHLFPMEVPPITGDHMPPIIIKSRADKEIKHGDVEKVECNIPCEIEKGFELKDRTDSFIHGERWKVSTIQNQQNNIKLERNAFRNDHYYSTQSLWSAVPLSTFDEKNLDFTHRTAVDFDAVKDKAIYLVDSKCSTKETKRNRWFEAVQEKMDVDAYGQCGHNIEVPEGMTTATPEGRIALMAQYRVVLAFDEVKAKDHISSMVWEALASGAVPVIIGAENIAERLPPNSFLNGNNFNAFSDLAEMVKTISSDKAKWQSYQKWRDDKDAIAEFEKQYGFTTIGPTCRMCRWAYAKKYGLGWDHTNQKVRSIPKLPKDQLCLTADHALVSKPFSEEYVSKNPSSDEAEAILAEDSEGESCSSLDTGGDIVSGAFRGHRKVYQHDGVTDLVLTEWSTDAENVETALRLKFPGVRNPDGSCFYNTHTLVSTEKGPNISSASIQDDTVKVTILANWDTAIKSTEEGIMEVSIIQDTNSGSKDGSAPRRVRVIIEEVNVVHDKMTEFYPSTYCQQMTKDFINPIGVFFVDS